MEVWNVRWVGIPTRQYEAMVVFMRDVLGLEINFQDQTTVEFRTVEGDGDPGNGRGSRWEWVHVRAPDDNLYELGSGGHRAESVPPQV
jgi:catechol 2,3-dioxygenase-like lactoylglutathione lyase family enzyme